MVDNRITGLVGETIRQLDNIMNITPGQAAKDVVKKAIEAAGFDIIEVLKDGEWRAIAAAKRQGKQ